MNQQHKKSLIIEKKTGNFKETSNLKNVPGIGEAKFDVIKEQITVK